MRRYVAVQVQHPRIDYAGLLRLDRPNHHARHLVTLQEGQREAVVEVVLIGRKKGEAPKVLSRLHTFHLKDLPARSAGRTQISLEGSYDGRRQARLRVSVAGRRQGEVSLSLPRERRRRFWPVVAVALVLLGAGLWWLTGSLGDSEERSAETITVERQERLETGEPAASPAESGDEVGSAEEAAAPQVSPPEEREEERAIDREPPPEREYVLYFEPDQTELTESARDELREIARFLREAAEARVRVVGHTALFGTEEGRLEISRGRAENVYQFLRQAGWDPETEAVVAWEGSTDPVTRDRGEQARNRRVEIEVGTAER
mgnify:FL=1